MENRRYSPEELTDLFRRVFGTEMGQEVLRVLDARFVRPAFVPNAIQDGNAIFPLVMMRVGEDNVIRYIKAQIERDLTTVGDEGDGRDTD